MAKTRLVSHLRATGLSGTRCRVDLWWQRGVLFSSAVLGALIAPPLACAIAQRLPPYLHPYIGNVLSMAISTLLIIPLIGALIE